MQLHIDIETYSQVDLRKAGLYRYAEDHSTEVLCVAWSVGNPKGHVYIWIPDPDAELFAGVEHDRLARVFHGDNCPPGLVEMFSDPDIELHAYNAAFERIVLNGPWATVYGVPETGIKRWHCTKVRAAAAGIPLDLKHACIAAGTRRKDEAGRTVMLQVSRPRKPTKDDGNLRFTPAAHPEKFSSLYSYCIDDVLAEKDLSNALPGGTDAERALYMVDQVINDTGILVDTLLCHEAAQVHTDWKARLNDSVRALTDGLSTSQVEGLRQWLGTHGLPMRDMRSQTVADTLARDDVPDNAREVLTAYTAANMKAPVKYSTARAAACRDDRLRGMFVFHGAATGRWSSRLVQLQNLKRPPPGQSSDDVARALHAGADADDLDLLFPGDPIDTLSWGVRSILKAGDGKRLVVCDLSQIEARVLQWGARHERVLDLYRDGQDVYRHTAGAMFGVDPDDVTPEQRFNGKTGTLALGYQGGVNAFMRMAAVYGVEVDEDTAEGLKILWREANAPVVNYWETLRRAAVSTVMHGTMAKVNQGMAVFEMRGKWLAMTLPSGRPVMYYKPAVEYDGGRQVLTYEGLDTFTRKWGRVRTYGGRLAENWTQAVARDVLAESITSLHARERFDIVGHVHDEVICEAPTGVADQVLTDVERTMRTVPSWAPGLPVDCAGYIAERYRKD